MIYIYYNTWLYTACLEKLLINHNPNVLFQKNFPVNFAASPTLSSAAVKDLSKPAVVHFKGHDISKFLTFAMCTISFLW